jgi:hypothetical protein
MKQFAAIRSLVPWLAFASVVFAPLNSAFAYVGPGLGGGAIAVVLGVVGSVFIAVFAVLWYPLKRFLKKRSSSPGVASDQQSTDGAS